LLSFLPFFCNAAMESRSTYVRQKKKKKTKQKKKGLLASRGGHSDGHKGERTTQGKTAAYTTPLCRRKGEN